MRRVALGSIAAAGLLAAQGSSALAAENRYALDPDHTVIAFEVMHAGFAPTLGRFRAFEGTFTYDSESEELSDLEVTVDMASLWTDQEARDDRVRSDVLDTASYPEMTFTMTGTERLGEDRGIVRGELSMYGESQPLELEVTRHREGTYPFGGGVFDDAPYYIGITAEGTLQRSDWGMDVGQQFGIADEVAITIHAEAAACDREGHETPGFCE